MNRTLHSALARGVRRGGLRVTYADGSSKHYGARSAPLELRLADEEAERALALDPALKLGELYMDGRLLIERGDVYDLLAVLKRNARSISTPLAALRYAFRYATAFAAERQTLVAARRNMAHHYDLNERFYRLFLDEDMQYTCAYFERDTQSLADAQLSKKRHIAAKLLLEPGQKVLDIGCGWGGLGLYLADVVGANVTGVTLSRLQHEVGMRRVRERGLEHQARFLLQDYRQTAGPFDRLVSVGMFEAIGLKEFRNYFTHCARLMTQRGVFLLHSIGRTRARPVPSPWLEKYIFPGSYIPALSEVLPEIERAGFMVADTEILRTHYAETLRHWRTRFVARRAEVEAIYDKRFFRMWEFYLAASEAGFRIDRLFVFQLQLIRNMSVVPIRRDYVAIQEAAFRSVESQRAAYRDVA